MNVTSLDDRGIEWVSKRLASICKTCVGPGFVDWVEIVAARYLRAHIFTFDSDFLSVGADVVPPRGL